MGWLRHEVWQNFGILVEPASYFGRVGKPLVMVNRGLCKHIQRTQLLVGVIIKNAIRGRSRKKFTKKRLVCLRRIGDSILPLIRWDLYSPL